MSALAVSEEAIAFLRRRLPAMLPAAQLSGKTIAENIAFGAAVLGAGHVELVARDRWWFVASNFNWLAASSAVAARAGGAPELAVFEKVQPFPEQAPTGHRAEIYVTAFAADAYYRVGAAVTWLRGERPPGALPDAGVTPAWCETVLAFRLP